LAVDEGKSLHTAATLALAGRPIQAEPNLTLVVLLSKILSLTWPSQSTRKETIDSSMAARIQAGGGVSAMAMPADDNTIKTFEGSVLASLRKIHEQLQKGGNVALHDEQKNLCTSNFAEFLKYMASPSSNALMPAPKPKLDLPFSSYFISTSHNTYLTGHQLYGKATVDGYKNVHSISPPFACSALPVLSELILYSEGAVARLQMCGDRLLGWRR
jgi:hypothetical protein